MILLFALYNVLKKQLLKATLRMKSFQSPFDTKGDVVVDQDEQPLNAKIDKIPLNLLCQDGTITAANASSISDGASALVLLSDVAAHVVYNL